MANHTSCDDIRHLLTQLFAPPLGLWQGRPRKRNRRNASPWRNWNMRWQTGLTSIGWSSPTVTLFLMCTPIHCPGRSHRPSGERCTLRLIGSGGQEADTKRPCLVYKEASRMG